MSQEEFLYLLDLTNKREISKEAISEGIKRLFLKDIFEDIIIEKNNKKITIRVKEKPTIKSIKFEGNENFDDKFLRKLLNFKIGDRLKIVELKKSSNHIRETLKKKGYPESQITFNTDCSQEFCIVTFTIREGIPLTVREIIWEGDVDEFLQGLLSLSVGAPFDETKMEDFVKKCKNYFEKQGIVNSTIAYSFKEGKILINLKKGEKVKVDFIGVEKLKRQDLNNLLNAYLKERLDENIIKDITNSLISLYYLNGFSEIKIYPILEKQDKMINLIFVINEGKRKIIEDIYLKFDEIKMEKKDINKIIINSPNSPFNLEELENDKKRIEDFLKAQGYYYAKIYQTEIKEEDEKIKIIFKVSEGKQIKIKTINLEIANEVMKDRVWELTKEFNNKIFTEEILLEIKRKIIDFYQRQGYAEVNVKSHYEINNDEAYIFFIINPGERKYFKKSIILGNRKTKTRFIYERLFQKENKPFNPYILEEERLSLYKTGLFSKIDIIYQKQDNYIDIIYDFEEVPAGAFDFGFGYGDYEKVKGFMELSYINLFGINKQIYSRIELSKIEKRSSIVYIDPWFWKDLIFKTSLNFEDRRVKNIDTKDILYELRRFSASAGFEKRLLENFKAELDYEISYSKIWDILPEVILSDQDIGRILISGFKVSLIYDDRDNPFDPKKGWLAGLSSKLSSEIFGSELNFLKTSFYLNKYTELYEGLVFAISLRGGWAWLYGKTDNLPISERYFLGGRDTVRGYAQNTLGPKRDDQPTGGNVFLMGNMELRTSLGRNFFIVNFLDAGNVWNRVGDVNPSKLKFTTGVGLRYKTPVGPIRVDYGYKLNRQKGESHSEIHFTIGHAF